MSTRAVRDGDHYVLNGRKVWITNAGVSSFYTVFAKTDPAAGSKGISAVRRRADTPGFSVGKLESKLGMRGSPTGEILLDDVAVPAERRIGDEHAAFGYAMDALERIPADHRRPGASGSPRAPSTSRPATPPSEPSSAATSPTSKASSSCSPTWPPASKRPASSSTGPARCSTPAPPASPARSAMAKLFASDAAMQITTDAVQVLGGAGYTRDFPAERMLRDAKITQIYEGTNQIQRIVIAEHC